VSNHQELSHVVLIPIPFSLCDMGGDCSHASCWVGEAGVGSSFIGFGVRGVLMLTRVLPVAVVGEVIAGAVGTERRHRSLPARVMAFFSLGMAFFSLGMAFFSLGTALFSEGSKEDVLELVTDGLAWSCAGGDPMPISGTSAVYEPNHFVKMLRDTVLKW